MYQPRAFEEPRIPVMAALMASAPLATLVTLAEGGLDADHIPLYWSPDPAPYGRLRGHVAAANPILEALATGREALAVFHGPQAYVSPNHYATKAEGGRVVPTWNYAVVHAYGAPALHRDPDWLWEMLTTLTTPREASAPQPWTLEDPPPGYIDGLLKGIVGIELVVSRLVGKWKVSQNQPRANRESVVAGLGGSGSEADAAVAALVEVALKGDP